ncbi:hypothetical protein ERO13_A06G067900v2 [Gossypium hirsutum]|uniref:Uncharacterized protein n=1 Tax=Gossypium barbadense TaxID=3634 RepID=A0A5J5VB29_GOSBA|nr:hypothetical protein ES319_A06G074300v1 [Gossypium barbadense]KAG4194699.1 hypothetical protein ERO13_A06G067900v2 [Gossypium hirsutum]
MVTLYTLSALFRDLGFLVHVNSLQYALVGSMCVSFYISRPLIHVAAGNNEITLRHAENESFHQVDIFDVYI